MNIIVEITLGLTIVLALWMLASISRKLRVIQWYLMKIGDKLGALETPPIHPERKPKE